MRSSIAFSALVSGAMLAAPPLPKHVSAIVIHPGGQSVKYGPTNVNYRLASVTKHITAAAVLSLVRPEETLHSFWPEFPASITIRHLLQHQSGRVHYEDHLPPGDHQVKDHDVLQILRRHPEPVFAPGSRFAYSNSGYVLLGLVVQQRAGRPFRQYLEEKFFRPLGMGCVAHEEGITTVARRAYGQPKDQSRTSATLGDGGVYCSLDGLEKWLNSPYALQESMLQPGLGDYGFGWFIRPGRIWHTGETAGFRNAILLDRASGKKVVVLSNHSGTNALQVAEQLLGQSR